MYRLILRSADESPPLVKHAKQVLRSVLTVASEGLIPPVGRSVLDIEEKSSGAVVARWESPPSAEGSHAWLPELQDELDLVGLEAFCEKYLAGPSETAPVASPPEPEFDEAALDRLWNTQPGSEPGAR
jgi:nucleotide-binding universal stress UspA family protein